MEHLPEEDAVLVLDFSHSLYTSQSQTVCFELIFHLHERNYYEILTQVAELTLEILSEVLLALGRINGEGGLDLSQALYVHDVVLQRERVKPAQNLL